VYSCTVLKCFGPNFQLFGSELEKIKYQQTQNKISTAKLENKKVADRKRHGAKWNDDFNNVFKAPCQWGRWKCCKQARKEKQDGDKTQIDDTRNRTRTTHGLPR
jgi:hypothetical protein